MKHLELTIINDGDGSQCGSPYDYRVSFGALRPIHRHNEGKISEATPEHDIPNHGARARKWLDMASRADRWHLRHTDATEPASTMELLKAALDVAAYYTPHTAAEGPSPWESGRVNTEKKKGALTGWIDPAIRNQFDPEE